VGAIVLIYEADVIMAERDLSHLRRSAIVAVSDEPMLESSSMLTAHSVLTPGRILSRPALYNDKQDREL
jgi:hypothetical protein